MLSQQELNIIKTTVLVLLDHVQKVLEVFYRNLLADNPEPNSIFNQGKPGERLPGAGSCRRGLCLCPAY